jgi:hypothetical protein
MKIVTLSFAAAIVAASVGMAEASQAHSTNSAPSRAWQGNAETGRSAAVPARPDYYNSNGPQNYEAAPPARGPYQVY